MPDAGPIEFLNDRGGMNVFATRFELIGRIGRCQVREVGDRKVLQLVVAVDREYKDEEGNRPTDWFDVELWSDNADKLAELLTKGRLVFLSGKMRQKIRERTAQTESGEEASYTEYGIRLIADDFRLLSAPKADAEEEGRASASLDRPASARSGAVGAAASAKAKGNGRANGYARKGAQAAPASRRGR